MSPTSKLQLGVIGLGTMGANIARNAARNGATVAVFNRTTERTREFMDAHGSEGAFVSCASLQDLKAALVAPRTILLMIKAGDAVDAMLEELLPLLKKGDTVIDGGNSHFLDTARREERCAKKGIHFVGMGVSGGEDGALHGPSMMPGGDLASLDRIKPLLQKMAADDGAGGKCVARMGNGGSGHFVKMVHNGVEYGLMQIIAETYDVLRSASGLGAAELSEVYQSWNEGVLQSFLLEITAKIFPVKDPETGEALVDVIKDAAGQKGTGKWTTEAAMTLGVGVPSISAAVDARILSSDPLARKRRSAELPESLPEPLPEGKPLADLARSAFLLSGVVTYLQGFDLLYAASREYQMDIRLSEVARIWRGGCIIRSGLLPIFQDFFAEEDAAVAARTKIFDLFRGDMQEDWRRFVSVAIDRGIPVPCIAASLSYYDTIRRQRLPQNLIQAQRDFFGAHTYERMDRDGTFHTQWE